MKKSTRCLITTDFSSLDHSNFKANFVKRSVSPDRQALTFHVSILFISGRTQATELSQLKTEQSGLGLRSAASACQSWQVIKAYRWEDLGGSGGGNLLSKWTWVEAYQISKSILDLCGCLSAYCLFRKVCPQTHGRNHLLHLALWHLTAAASDQHNSAKNWGLVVWGFCFVFFRPQC